MELEFTQDEDLATRNYTAIGVIENGVFIPSKTKIIPEITMSEYLKRNKELQRLSLFSSTERTKKKKNKRRTQRPPRFCAICLANKPERKNIPCRHWTFCKRCWDIYKEDFCPLCKQNLDYVVIRQK